MKIKYPSQSMAAGILSVFLGFAFADNSMAQQSEVDKVKAANDGYYVALSARDLQAMEQVWSRTAEVVNIAPPVRPSAHVGWEAVKKNYTEFWNTLDQLTVSMEKPTIVIKGPVAWVYGIENAQRRTKGGETSGGRISERASLSTKVAAGSWFFTKPLSSLSGLDQRQGFRRSKMCVEPLQGLLRECVRCTLISARASTKFTRV